MNHSLENKQDPYDVVPHQGQHFTEDGCTFYWTYDSHRTVKVGDRLKGIKTAWRPTGMCRVVKIADEPVIITELGGTPVTPIVLHNPGYYYEVPYDLTVVAEAQTKYGRIVKWQINEESNACDWLHSFKLSDLT